MALTPYNQTDGDVRSLPNQPVITPAALKQTFDQFGIFMKSYFNTVHIPEVEAAIATGTSNPQLIYDLYNFDTLCQTLKGYYKVTEFDTPSSGNITETLYNTVEDAIFGVKVTLFDTPSVGNIQETLSIESINVGVVKTTVFDSPSVGKITETYSEIIPV